MLARGFYRTAFALGVTVFLGAFGFGVLQAWRGNGWIPALPLDELGQGREAAAVGDFATAERQLRTYALLQPENSDGWVRLGQFLQTRSDRRGAIAAFERSVQIIPAPLVAYQALAVLYYQEGERALAREHGLIALRNGADLPPDVRQALGL